MPPFNKFKLFLREIAVEMEAAQDQEDAGGAWMGVIRRRGGYYSHRIATGLEVQTQCLMSLMSLRMRF